MGNKSNAHEPAPWILGGISGRMITTPSGYCGDGFIADVDTLANAAFIVEACNNYEALKAENRRLRDALEQVAEWRLPETGEFWDNDKTRPMSYEAAFGSNGSRDYFKGIAKQALEEKP